MSPKLRNMIVGVILLISLGLVWLLGSTDGSGNKRKNAYVSAKWEKDYGWADKDAYGLYILDELIKDHTRGSIPGSITNATLLDSLTKSKDKYTLIFIGKDFGMYDEELDTLFSLVERGSDLFISATGFTENLVNSFTPELDLRFEYSEQIKVKIDTNHYNFLFQHQRDTLARSWHVIHKNGPVEPPAKAVSTINGKPNFIEIPFGSGRIMIHSTPELFHNYQLAQKDGFFHAEKVVSSFNRKKKVCYLELARLEDELPLDEEPVEEAKGKRDDSYLQFLLRTPSLRIAMLLSLFGLVLFLLFRAKRMQPRIDFIPEKRNISFAFVQTVASIYRNKDNPYSLLQLLRKNFYSTIKKHFFTDLSKRTDHIEIHHLSQRCNISTEEIEHLLDRLETTNVSKVNEDYLVETARLKREFYLRSGVVSERILNRLDNREFSIYRNSWLSFPLILCGIVVILYGLYLAVNSNGVGPALWIPGTVLLAWGILRISRPLLKVDHEKIEHYPLVGRKKAHEHHELVSAEKFADRTTLSFSDGRTVIVLHAETDNRSIKILEQFLIRKQMIEL
jgi:hypothetical protein